MRNEKLAKQFITAIKELADKPENLANLENYLSYHFEEWLAKWANSPENITAEMKEFAKMEF